MPTMAVLTPEPRGLARSARLLTARGAHQEFDEMLIPGSGLQHREHVRRRKHVGTEKGSTPSPRSTRGSLGVTTT